MKAGIYEEIGGLEQPESTSQSVIRNVARGGARAAETFLGLPGDIAKGGLSLANLGIEKLTGKESPLPKSLPIAGSEEYRKYITQPLTGEYLEPKGRTEKGIDELVSDFTSLMIPVGGASLGIKRAAAAAGLGNLASWVTEGIGGGEGAKTGAKVGAMLLASSVSPKALRRHMSELYSTAENSIPEAATVSARPIEEQISKTKAKLKHGGDTTIKKEIYNKINDLQKKMKPDKKIPVKDVWAFKREFNDAIRKKGGLPELSGIEKDLSPFVNSLNQTLENYGKVNPKFNYKALKKADDIWQGINVHSGIKKFLRDTVTPKNIIVGGLFGMTHPHALSKGIGAAVGSRLAVEAIEPALRSPTIRKYYIKTLASAAAKNKNATLKNFSDLEKVIEKEHPESKSSGMYEEISFQ